MQTNYQCSVLAETTRFVYLLNCYRQTLRHLLERKTLFLKIKLQLRLCCVFTTIVGLF